MTASEISRFETGQRSIPRNRAIQLARLMEELTAGELMEVAEDRAVRLTWRIGSAFGEALGGEGPRVAGDERLSVPASIDHPEQCFAATVVDDSADLMYPPGSILIARRLEFVARPLQLGMKVIAAAYRERPVAKDARAIEAARLAREDGADVVEVLAGILDRSAAVGDVTVAIRSRNRQMPATLLIQRAHFGGLGDRQMRFHVPPVGDPAIQYDPLPDDPGAILGRIVFAMTPE